MKESKWWILLTGFLIISIWFAYSIVNIVRNTADSIQANTENSLKPINDFTGSLATQVSDLLHPTPTIYPDPVTIIHEVRAIARLETIQYSVEKIVTADTNRAIEFLFEDKLIFVAHGIVIAGIDLGRLTPDDMTVDSGILYVTLPEAEIFIATLDNQKSYVYDRETGLFTKGDINLETTARQVAEDEIRKAALEDNILDLARQNGEHYIRGLLSNLGYVDIEFVSPIGD